MGIFSGSGFEAAYKLTVAVLVFLDLLIFWYSVSSFKYLQRIIY
jgi:hypothetical protein